MTVITLIAQELSAAILCSRYYMLYYCVHQLILADIEGGIARVCLVVTSLFDGL